MAKRKYNLTLQPITVEQLRNYIKIGFKDDADLSKYHVATAENKRDLVLHTYRRILEAQLYMNLEFFRIIYSGEGRIPDTQLIGYTVISREPTPMLYSFAINHRFRTSVVLPQWLAAIERELGELYVIPLNPINTRAIKFFEQNGFVQHLQDEEKTILCQSQQL